MEVGDQRHSPNALLPGTYTHYPLHRRLGGVQGQSGRARKISSPAEFDSRTIQTFASRCTDWAIPVHVLISRQEKHYFLRYTDKKCRSPAVFCVSVFPFTVTRQVSFILAEAQVPVYKLVWYSACLLSCTDRAGWHTLTKLHGITSLNTATFYQWC